jgi:hypothetical protein
MLLLGHLKTRSRRTAAVFESEPHREYLRAMPPSLREASAPSLRRSIRASLTQWARERVGSGQGQGTSVCAAVLFGNELPARLRYVQIVDVQSVLFRKRLLEQQQCVEPEKCDGRRGRSAFVRAAR